MIFMTPRFRENVITKIGETWMDRKNEYITAIKEYAAGNYRKMFREMEGNLRYKFIVPGSCYHNELWDWDSWLTNLALDQFADGTEMEEYEKGCILNFLECTDEEGKMPIFITPTKIFPDFSKEQETNIHKPVLAQHALFVAKKYGEAEWLRPYFDKIERYLGFYLKNCRHQGTGLFYWINDCAIGVDNDPCTFYRPERSSGSILLNCFMFKELLAAGELAARLRLTERAKYYEEQAVQLKSAVQEHCWDERDGFYYSVDLNLLPVNKDVWLHSGYPRHWECLIQRIGVWSGFLAMWSGIATKEQAARMVRDHYLNEKSFYAPYGVRTLSKQEKMYAVVRSGNPSCWLGPVWGISNYMVFKGLVDYEYVEEAKDICMKTIELFGKDILENGQMHEYYDPESGVGVNNPGFQNWNLLVINMIHWIECRDFSLA